MASEEILLWDELHRLHLAQLSSRTVSSEAARKMHLHEANMYYSTKLYARSSALTSGVFDWLCDGNLSEETRMLRFHAYRRMLSIIHQEEEMLHLDDAQARAVGEDGAFIAAGRR